jgi:hypothetical protein
MPLLLLLETLLQRLHQLFPAAHGFNGGLFLRREMQFRLLQQPFQRKVDLGANQRFDTMKESAEGLVKLVEVGLVLDQRQAGQVVEVLDRWGDDTLLHPLHQCEVFLDGNRNLGFLELEEKAGEHGAWPSCDPDGS